MCMWCVILKSRLLFLLHSLIIPFLILEIKCCEMLSLQRAAWQQQRSDLFPGFCLHQKVAKTATVDRLTDTSRYTGSHKERFDESGRGKGREGREELVENTGYVGAYKNAGTYDSKMKAEKWGGRRECSLLEADRMCSPATALSLDQTLNFDPQRCLRVWEHACVCVIGHSFMFSLMSCTSKWRAVFVSVRFIEILLFAINITVRRTTKGNLQSHSVWMCSLSGISMESFSSLAPFSGAFGYYSTNSSLKRENESLLHLLRPRPPAW